MKILDLFCGLKGWSNVWAEAGHEVITVDIDPVFEPTLCVDILDLYLMNPGYDVILASPPCETFSVASIGHHWTGGARAYKPKTPEAEVGMKLVQQTVSIIETLKPRYAVIENPRGVLRKLGIIPWEPNVHWYCHYGESRAKPTDLWVRGFDFPDNLCHNRRPEHSEDCCCRDHEAASRGARTGTQGIGTYADRSEIPRGLARAVMSKILEDA